MANATSVDDAVTYIKGSERAEVIVVKDGLNGAADILGRGKPPCPCIQDSECLLDRLR